ncbi:enoyl-CoA hydratase/isomerase family protein [Rhodococcus sp. SJ-2]
MRAPLRNYRSGSVVHLVLDAPQRRNALSRTMLDALEAALSSLDDDVTGVVLAGSDGTFSAGADFADITGTVADVDYDDAVARVAAAVTTAAVPVVAALEGPCMGAAAHLALVCDMRIGGEGAYLHVPSVRLGLLYNPVAIRELSRAYSRDTVRRLLLIGERFDTESAYQAGLLSRTVPTGDAVRVATDMLATLPQEHRQATRATKELLGELDSGLFDENRWQRRRRELLGSPARAAAVRDARARHTPHMGEQKGEER